MSLAVAASWRRGDFVLDASFESEHGLVGLIGASGCGKTSLLRVIAGLDRPDHARIVIDGAVVIDTAAGIDVPVHKRRIGFVFQDGRLFPHLSVRSNLAYGRWFAGRGANKPQIEPVTEMLGLSALLDRRPAQLSGGERQRVALGRALLAGPRALLLDEPLAAVDAARKDEVLPYIERLRDQLSLPIVYVSHVPGEVARLADHLVVMESGRVTAAGPLLEILGRLDLPVLHARRDAGASLPGVILRHDAEFGLTVVESPAGVMRVALLNASPGTPIRLWIEARDVLIALSPPHDTSALNVLRGRVTATAPVQGSLVEAAIDCGGATLYARLTGFSAQRLGIVPGREVYAIVKSVAVDPAVFGVAANAAKPGD